MNTTRIIAPTAVLTMLVLTATPVRAQHGGGHSRGGSAAPRGGGGPRGAGGGPRGFARPSFGSPRAMNVAPRAAAGNRSVAFQRGGAGVRGGAVVRGGAGVRIAPRVIGPRGIVGSPGFYRPYYRPYYAFRPRLSLGFGLWVGYPVTYPYYYGYYGYSDPYAYPYPYPYSAPYAYQPYGYAAPGYGYSTPGYGYPAPNSSSGYPPQYTAPGSVGVQQGERASGGVSFEITPSTAAVFVDGTYVGTVVSFGPTSQPLGLTPGRHHIEIRASGYQTMTFDTDVMPGQVIPYQGTLQAQ
jgi:hypothetical protein